MAKKIYYCGKIGDEILKNHSTEKAFFVGYDVSGFGKAKMVWIPKSICKFRKPCEDAKELGWTEVCIPQWFFNKNQVDHRRFVEVNWNCNGDPFMVEM